MTENGFSTLVSQVRAFLRHLSANNNRDWFTANKAAYEAQVKRPAGLLLDEMAARIEKREGHAVKSKLYRIHRDLRFSRDKTPYNTHLHLQWAAAEPPHLAWYFGLSQDYFCAGAGMMAFAPPDLIRWREAMAGRAGGKIAGDITALTEQGFRLDAPELKRIPPPYDKDHPRGDLLRRKSLVLWHDLPDNAAPDLTQNLDQTFATLAPLQARLRVVLDPKG